MSLAICAQKQHEMSARVLISTFGRAMLFCHPNFKRMTKKQKFNGRKYREKQSRTSQSQSAARGCANSELNILQCGQHREDPIVRFNPHLPYICECANKVQPTKCSVFSREKFARLTLSVAQHCCRAMSDVFGTTEIKELKQNL